MCAGTGSGYNDDWGRSPNVEENRIIWLTCPRLAHEYFLSNPCFESLKAWATSKFQDVTTTPLGNVWVLSPGPGCENDIAEMS